MTKVITLKPESKKFAMYYTFSEDEINKAIENEESAGWKFLSSQMVFTDGTSGQLILFFQK